MLTINDLTVNYDTHTVLRNLHWDLEAGCVHGLVGLNGAGKTTLLNTMYGLTKKSKGEILYHNSPLRREKISFLQTENYFYSMITGREYLNFFLYYNPHYKLASLLDFFHLPLDELVDTYSTGMRKKLAILASLILDKEIVIFDEPFNGIDIESVFVVSKLIGQLRGKQKIIIITSHILDSLTPLCDKIHWLKDGEINKSFERTEFSLLKSSLEENLQEKYSSMNDILL